LNHSRICPFTRQNRVPVSLPVRIYMGEACYTTFLCYIGFMDALEPARLLSARECAILALRLIERRSENGNPPTRVRISELTLRRLWGRSRLDLDFVGEVQEWLWRGGWSLFFAQNTYAAIKTAAVQNWIRVSSKLIAEELELVEQGKFNFSGHEHLLSARQVSDGED
jgi:hypothetical protein